MFFLTLPVDAPNSGTCRVNGHETSYRLHADIIEYADTDGVWKSKPILHREQCGDGLLHFTCGDYVGQAWGTDGLAIWVEPALQP